MHRLFRMLFNIADQVHAPGKLAGSGQIGENDVPGKREEGILKLVAITRSSRNVEFHHK